MCGWVCGPEGDELLDRALDAPTWAWVGFIVLALCALIVGYQLLRSLLRLLYGSTTSRVLTAGITGALALALATQQLASALAMVALVLVGWVFYLVTRG